MMKHVIEDAMKHGGVQQNFNDVFGDFIIAVVAGRYVFNKPGVDLHIN